MKRIIRAGAALLAALCAGGCAAYPAGETAGVSAGLESAGEADGFDRSGGAGAGSGILGGADTGDGVSGGAGTREKERLVIWSYYETTAQQEAMDELTEGFNAVSQSYTLEWEYVPMTEFSKRLSIGYTENAMPDLVIMDNPDMPYYIKTGLLEEITDMEGELRLYEDYYSALLGTVYDKGKLYGLPLNCNTVALIYHTEMLQEAGIAPPENWQEFQEAVKALSGDGRYGFLMSAITGEQGAFQIMPWILSAGEDIREIGGDGTAKAYDFLYGLIASGGMDPNCINYSQIDVARKFIQGEAAMMENGPWILPMLEEAGISYGVTFLPADERRQTVIGGENIGILKGKNTKGAREFLRYCAGDQVMSAFCEKTGVLPTKRRLAGEGDGKTDVFRRQMENAVLRTENEHWSALRDRLPEGIYEMMAEGRTAEEIAASLRGE